MDDSRRNFALPCRWNELFKKLIPAIFRCYVSTTVLGEFIYAMGGYDGQVRQNTAERYLPSKNQWSLIASMHNRRSDASATALDGKNK